MRDLELRALGHEGVYECLVFNRFTSTLWFRNGPLENRSIWNDDMVIVAMASHFILVLCQLLQVFEIKQLLNKWRNVNKTLRTVYER